MSALSRLCAFCLILFSLAIAAGDSARHPFADSIAATKQFIQERRRVADSLSVRLAAERERLIVQFELVVSTCPLVRYNDPIYLRLAELYYEKAEGRFEEALTQYETDLQRLDKGELTKEPEFPSYDFSEAIRTYDRVITQYPNSPYVDDAMYYKGLCIEKQSGLALALRQYQSLVDAHPQSEYRVEALMKIAGYNFDHPREVGQGYQKAAEIYKKILAYRENRNFVEALYRLGWCYYMEDRYPEAISVFKYLIEEIEPDFDESRADDRTNPLLRSEAVDFLAVSFFESGSLAQALEFLHLVGNRDYAAIVLSRLGELYEEQARYDGALEVYAALLRYYPLSTEAPAAQLAQARCYGRMGNEQKADSARVSFFDQFARGGEWQRANQRSSRLAKINDEAIKALMSVADRQLGAARTGNSRELYAAAAQNYQKLIKVYFKSPGTYEAHWNLAVVLDQNLQDYPGALREYLRLCNDYVKDNRHKKEAAINAVAMAQNILGAAPAISADSLRHTRRLEPPAANLVSACTNFLRFYPGEAEAPGILFIAASTCYNRGLFQEAVGFLQEIVKRTPPPREFESSIQFIAQSYTGLGQYDKAAEWYEKLLAVAGSPEIKKEAFKRLVETRYRLAEAALTSGDLKLAATLFYDIAKRYPESEYADVVLFSAADANEKLGQWKEAARIYDTLVTRYPKSNQAAGALFNAALALERDSNFVKASDTYERLVRSYPQASQIKDALFNLALCYEKLGRLDKVAETHERFAALFPQAEEVERLLFESAKFYRKSNMAERALKVFRRFSQSYPGNPLAVEALYTAGSILMEQNRKTAALAEWEAAANLNANQKKAGGAGNDYFAAEAVFASAGEYGRQFSELRIAGTGERLKESVKQKNDALQRAALKYEEAARYRTVRIFEASYAIGRLYEDFALAYWKQDRPVIANPLKKIVLEKDIGEAVALLVLRAVEPYAAVCKLASAAADSIPAEAMGIVGKAKNGLAEVAYKAGEFHAQSASLLESSPLPDAIKQDPLQVALYRSKLLQTVAPIKEKALSVWLDGRRRLDSSGVNNDWSAKVSDALSEMNFKQGYDFEKLAIEILTQAKNPAQTAEVDDDLAFQLEDVAYDLQDAALARYKVSLERARLENLRDRWVDQILERLAIMDPDHYAPNKTTVLASISSDTSWSAVASPADPDADWYKADLKNEDWPKAGLGQPKGALPFLVGPPVAIWAATTEKRVYFRKAFSLKGKPLSGELFVTADDNFRVYVNGAYLACDDSIQEDWMEIKRFNVGELLQNGENLVAAMAENTNESGFAFAAILQAKIDTSKASPRGTETDAKRSAASSPEGKRSSSEGTAKADQPDSASQPAASIPKNRKEFDARMAELSMRAKRSDRYQSRENIRIENLRYQLRLYNDRILNARKEIESLKAMIEGKRRKK